MVVSPERPEAGLSATMCPITGDLSEPLSPWRPSLLFKCLVIPVTLFYVFHLLRFFVCIFCFILLDYVFLVQFHHKNIYKLDIYIIHLSKYF